MATKIWLSRDDDPILGEFHNLWLGEPLYYNEVGIYSPDDDAIFIGQFKLDQLHGVAELKPGQRRGIVLKYSGPLLDGREHNGGTQ